MLEWLQSIGDFLINIIEFIVSFFQNAVEICILVFKAFAFASVAITYLPLQYQAVILALVSYFVIRTIIHFGG